MKLTQTNNGLELTISEGEETHSYRVDFLSPKSEHRRLYGGGRGQLIAKAVGVKANETLRVLDLTAGFARDAYVLACLGCDVTMLERSDIVYQLVNDAMLRAKDDEHFKQLKLTLIQADAIDFLKKLSEKDYPDVIYIDPMFPERKKSALVKKEMRMLKAIVGDDIDADDLLKLALGKAKKRVVLKRPKLAPTLEGTEPNVVYKGKSGRFDVYQ